MSTINSFGRFLRRNKLYTFIEFFGLCIALAFIILIFNYSLQETSVPKGQKDADKIYVMGTDTFIGMTRGTAEMVCPAIPEIEKYTRISCNDDLDAVVDNGYYKISSMSVDDDFLDFFSFDLVRGNLSGALKSSDNVIISQKFANEAFGGVDNAIGRSIEIILDETKVNLIVSGVIKDFNNHIFNPVDVILNLNHPVIYSQERVGNPLDHWGNTEVFVKLAGGSDRDKVNEKILAQFKNVWYDGLLFDKYSYDMGSSLTGMNEIYFTEINSPFRHGNKNMMIILLIAALVLLVSAILNYLNLSIAQSGKRAREMATRRLLGSSKGSVLLRYCIESLLFCTICFIIAASLAWLFNNTAEGLLDTKLSFVPNIELVGMYIATLMVIALTSGTVQYLFVSRMKPVDVLKGEFALRSGNNFSRVFIIIQSSISIVLLSLAFTMQGQMNYLLNRPRGYNIDNLVYVSSGSFYDRGKFEVLLNELKKLPFVKKAGLCNGSPCLCQGQVVTSKDGEDMLIKMMSIDSTCFNMLGFKVLTSFEEGVQFSGYYTEDAIKTIGGIETARNEQRLPCCGVIEDFVYGSATYINTSGMPSGNAVCLLPDRLEWIMGILLLTDGDTPDAIERINAMWDSVKVNITSNPAPLNVQWLSDMVYGDLKGPRNTMRLIMAFMILSIIISLLGLYAICSYFTNQNSKNIAINKVFGAQTREVVGKYSKSFLWSIVISVVISVPVAVYVISRYLETFSDRINLSYWVIVIAALISVLFSMIVIIGQILDAASDDPVKNLKGNN